MLSDQDGGVRHPAGLRPAESTDLDRVLQLLSSSGLPTAGVAGAFERFVGATRDDRIVGAAGLEVAGSSGLLRSVVVAGNERGYGTGSALVRGIIAVAQEIGLVELWLLTETAAPLFAGLGFQVRNRTEAPPEIAATEEFRSCCPASATAMWLEP